MARSWMTPPIRSREIHQRRAAHRSHEQVHLLRTIARVEAALQDGPQVTRVTRAQDLVLDDMDIALNSPLSPLEKLSITSTEAWTKYLRASLKSCKEDLERQTHTQVRENRRSLDRRARKAFEDEHKGPCKFAGKRTEHRNQALNSRVPHGWVEWHDRALDAEWDERLAMVRTFLKVYMEIGSYFLFLQEQIKDIIICCDKQVRASKSIIWWGKRV